MNIFFIDGSKAGSGTPATLLPDDMNYQIVGFMENPDNALRALPQLAPDVVILDIEMPGRSGIDLLRQIKRDYPSLSVIIFTRASHILYRAKCKAAGADYFFDKTKELRLIPLALRELAERRQILR